MDGISSGMEVTFSIESLKEPRGFIRFLELILSIFAFATTTSHDSYTTFSINCDEVPYATKTGLETVTYQYSYSYDLDEVCFPTPVCNTTKTGSFCLLAGAESAAQFYVFIGVIVFLYCIAALALYVVFDEFYRRNSRIIVVDFIVSVVLTLLWLISSCAWAQGVTDVKMYTDPDGGSVFDLMTECGVTPQNDHCQTVNIGNFASLNVSIIFGFLNFAVWVGNLWFLYKETPWFKVQQSMPGTPASAASSPGPAPTEGGAIA